MKNKVYPDFLVHLETGNDTVRLLVLETKGKFLEGSADTEFKSKFFEFLEKAYTQGYEAGEIELFADAPEIMRFKILIEEQAWKNDLETVLAAS
jgi:restriction endonuclease